MKKLIMYLLCLFSAFTTMASDSLLLTVHEGKLLNENGKVKSIFQYININGQILHGEYKEYFDNGSISIKGEYFFNIRVGKWKHFDSKGVVIDVVSHEESSLDFKDRINDNNTSIQKLYKEIDALKLSIRPEPYEYFGTVGTVDLKRGVSTFFGVLQIVGGTLGLILTIVDANSELGKDLDGDPIMNEWGKMHTVCLSLSITCLFSGIGTILISN